jgi:hypothetical protein
MAVESTETTRERVDPGSGQTGDPMAEILSSPAASGWPILQGELHA